MKRVLFHGLEFAGGKVFRHGNQAAASFNLTPDPSGIGYYDEKDPPALGRPNLRETPLLQHATPVIGPAFVGSRRSAPFP
jgi:hypothetical protein